MMLALLNLLQFMRRRICSFYLSVIIFNIFIIFRSGRRGEIKEEIILQ
jgi:hypothetical protein